MPLAASAVDKRLMVVFSGAGLSAESGLPTFRAADGLWEQQRIEDVATPEGFRRDPKLVLDFYAQRLKACQAAAPNPAHLAIAGLQQLYEVVNFTQNIDDLLERAGCTRVHHVHGSLFRAQQIENFSTRAFHQARTPTSCFHMLIIEPIGNNSNIYLTYCAFETKSFLLASHPNRRSNRNLCVRRSSDVAERDNPVCLHISKSYQYDSI